MSIRGKGVEEPGSSGSLAPRRRLRVRPETPDDVDIWPFGEDPERKWSSEKAQGDAMLRPLFPMAVDRNPQTPNPRPVTS